MSILDYMPNHVEQLINKIVERVKPFIDKVDKYVVSFSGGKDSTALLLIMNKYFRDKMYVVFEHIAGNTHFSNVEYVNYVARKLGLKRIVIRAVARKLLDKPKLPSPPTLIHVISLGATGRGFWDDVEKYGFPVPTERSERIGGMRWCCANFKHKPAEGLYDYYRFRLTVVGVKASDSPYRRRHFEKHGWILDYGYYRALRPMYDLNDQDVWSIIKYLDHDIYERLRQLYDTYGGAVNCMICPLMSTTKMLLLYTTLDPATRKNLLNIVDKLLERHNGKFTVKVLTNIRKALEITSCSRE